MPRAHRVFDLSAQRGQARPSITASHNVMINGRGAHRIGDLWLRRGRTVSATGSPTVFVNSRPLVRVGDLVCDGAIVITGSHNVFVNDK